MCKMYVMQVQSCCFANLTLLLCCRSRYRPRRRCLKGRDHGYAHARRLSFQE